MHPSARARRPFEDQLVKLKIVANPLRYIGIRYAYDTEIRRRILSLRGVLAGGLRSNRAA